MVTLSEDWGAKFSAEYEKVKAETQRPNIFVAGGTGVGKSTLVNLVMKREAAVAGAGKPVTQGIQTFESELLVIHDSEGYESGEENQQRFIQLIGDFLFERAKSPTTAINFVWYCISAPSARVTDCDIKLINLLQSRNIKVAAVLTQVDISTDEQISSLVSVLNSSCPGVPVFEASTDESVLTKGKDLDALYAWSLENLDEARQEAFIAASLRNIDAKYARGGTIVLQTIPQAAAAALSPLPASDAALLLPIQGAMMARLLHLWELSVMENIAGLAAAQVMPIIGRMLAGNLLKLIPGLGSAAGAAINAAVASALTYGLGTATNMTCKKLVESGLDETIKDYGHAFSSPEFTDMVRNLTKEYKK